MYASNRTVDILLWVALRPLKRGSLEDYLVALVRGCVQAGLKAHVVMVEPGNDRRETFRSEPDFSHEYLSEEQHSRGAMLLRYVRALRPKILHLQFFGLGSSLIPWARLGFRGCLLVHDHTSREVAEPRQGLWAGAMGSVRNLRVRLLLGLIDRVIPVSIFLVEELRTEVRIPDSKVELVYNGVDIERFRPARGPAEKEFLAEALLGRDTAGPLVTFVGALTPSKGIEDFISVAETMLQHGCNARFVIVGDGELREAVTQRCGSDNRHLRYLGLRDDVPEILRASDIFVGPYRWKEAFGLTLAEAAASGIPIVASNVGAIREIVDDGGTGILIEPGGKYAMQTAIQRLLDDDRLRHRMGEAARCRAEELFSLSGAVKRTVGIYRRCLSDGGRAARR